MKTSPSGVARSTSPTEERGAGDNDDDDNEAADPVEEDKAAAMGGSGDAVVAAVAPAAATDGVNIVDGDVDIVVDNANGGGWAWECHESLDPTNGVPWCVWVCVEIEDLRAIALLMLLLVVFVFMFVFVILTGSGDTIGVA